MDVSQRSIVVFACALALAGPASASGAYSSGSPEQVAWVRSAASRFVSAELSGSGASACAVLAAPLRATRRHRTCAERWDAKLSGMLRKPGGRARLRREQRAIPSARVVVHGNIARIELPLELLGSQNRFRWTENCWMLEG
jgi:hypothetical protein